MLQPVEHPPLPKAVESHDDIDAIRAVLKANTKPIEPDNVTLVAHVPLSDALAAVLAQVHQDGALVRGLDGAERTLRNEAKGMAKADQKSGAVRKARISRILLLSGDGSKRFYRDAAFLLKHHHDRLLVLKLDTDESTLGRAVFNADQQARAVLVVQKNAVFSTLVALANHF